MKEHGDEHGMLWNTEVYIGNSAARNAKLRGPSLPIPSEYKIPDYRSILGCSRIALDIETSDPQLEEKGPGVYRGDGYIIGLAIDYGDGDSRYYPVRHSVGDQLDPNRFFPLLASEAAQFDGILVNANLQYDLDWLGNEGVFFTNCKFFDVQYAEPLLNENRLSYRLEVLGQYYLGIGKFKSTLESNYGENFIKHLKDIHPYYVAEYACGDVFLPLGIMDKQIPLLAAEGLTELCELEHGLLPLLLQMRRTGVRIDLAAAEEANRQCIAEAIAISDEIRDMVGFAVNVDAADSIAKAFDKMSMTYPRTEKTKAPSFTKNWLRAHPHKLPQLITKKRGIEKTSGTFLNNYMLKGHVNGRIHCMFHPLKGEEGGAVSGRFSSSDPNLQNIPARDPVLGPMCRRVFVPEEEQDWGRIDWSQIEYRFLLHYAVATNCQGAYDTAQLYHQDKGMDFHHLAATIAYHGQEITKQLRETAKGINFGIAYGLGVAGLASNLGVSMEESKPILQEFHSRLPWLKQIYNKALNQAANKGYIKTIMNRRQRFDVWESAGWGNDKQYLVKEKYELLTDLDKRGFKRARTHKALNALLQGSAADLMKKSMVMAYNQGLFKVLAPHLTVHDELGVSVPRTAEGREAFEQLVYIMEHALELKVPILASSKIGANWSECK